MTISTTTNRASYNGNGVTTAFSFPYLFFQNGDLQVYLVSTTGISTLLTITTNYTVAGAGLDGGGTVTMLVAPAVGERLVIVREVALTQETDYISGDPFPAETHERALDRLTMQTQQLSEEVGRALRLNVTSETVAAELPSAETGKLLGWNSSGEIVNLEPVAFGAESIGTAELQDSSVTTEKLGDDSVTFSKIAPSAGADIASAATLDLTARTGNIVRITGTTATTAVTLNNGDLVECIAVAAWPLTYNVTTMPTPGGVSYTCSAGEKVVFTKDNSGVITVEIFPKSGQPVAQVITAKIADANITAAKLSGAQSGSAPVYGCRAWCVFDGTLAGTNAPTAGGNVTNVTRNSAGNYTVNFTTAMSDANYAAVVGTETNAGTAVYLASVDYDTLPTTSAVRIATFISNTAAAADTRYVTVSIFR